jgi:hypothetical protein
MVGGHRGGDGAEAFAEAFADGVVDGGLGEEGTGEKWSP